MYELNVDENIKSEIVNNINGGQYGPEIFQQAKLTVTNMLKYYVLPLWKESPDFKRILQKDETKNWKHLKGLKQAKEKRQSAILELEAFK